MLINKHTNKEIGNMGEFLIEEYIRKNVTGILVKDVSKNKNQGDLLVEYKNYKIMIEIKNWKSDITKNDIDKFKRDLENNETVYEAGIMLSLNTNIQNNKDMDYEITNSGKIALYINNLLDNKKSLILSIKFIVNTKEICLSDKLITQLYESVKNDIRLLIVFKNQLKDDKKYTDYRHNIHMKNIDELETEITKKIIKIEKG